MKLSTLVILSALFTSTVAFSAPTYSQFYLMNGKQVNAQEAIIASLKGSEAFLCKSVAASVSKSGTSIGIKAIKKPAKTVAATASN